MSDNDIHSDLISEFPEGKLHCPPWNGFDVFLLFCFHLLIVLSTVSAVTEWAGVHPSTKPEAQTPQDVQTTGDVSKKEAVKHPISQLIRQSRTPSVFLIAFFSAVLAAPLTEEFFYRLLLQGWLEKASATARHVDPALRFIFPPGVFSVTMASVIFALNHAGPRRELDADYLFYSLLGLGIGNLLALTFSIVFLVVVRKAKCRDFGIIPKRILWDFLLAVALFLPTVLPVLYLNAILSGLFPQSVVDPVPLLLFALILGTIFYRTGRLLPCVFLHVFLNGFSFFVSMR